jgi:hypothetical protein
VTTNDPPVVPVVIEEPVGVPPRAVKVPPPLEVKITVASVFRPWLSVNNTVTVVVAPLPIGLLPKLMKRLATGPAELPKPVVVPLDKLLLLLLSPEEQPNKYKKTRTISPQRDIGADNLERRALVPTGDIFVLPFPTGLVITAIGIQVILSVGPRGLVDIWLSPRVQGNPFLQIGALPFFNPRTGHQSV